ncbi:MAG: histidine phosphatase family protein [Tissierellia bacterium]|nr:histidine phosphatase family protein [Tissierellia bacterium]
MTKIYLIRHGQSEWNLLSKVQGQKDANLTDLGREQARKLGERLIDEDIDIIYSSDLSRALETAKIISSIINKPIVESKEIREINFGIWEGLTLEEILKKHKEQYLIWMKNPVQFKLEGAETLEALKDRVMNYVEKIILENKDKNIAIVSHNATLKIIILNLLGMGNAFYKNISLHNVSLSIVECRQYNNVLTLLNDTSHLKGL